MLPKLSPYCKSGLVDIPYADLKASKGANLKRWKKLARRKDEERKKEFVG